MYKKRYILILILIIAPLIAYLPTIWNDFLYYWDDQWQVTNKYTSGGFIWGNVSSIFSEFLEGQYSPVNQMMYLLIYTLFGYDPAAFHIASLILHIFNTLFIFFIINKLLYLSKTSEKININIVAFVAALLFAVHPINVESTA